MYICLGELFITVCLLEKVTTMKERRAHAAAPESRPVPRGRGREVRREVDVEAVKRGWVAGAEAALRSAEPDAEPAAGPAVPTVQPRPEWPACVCVRAGHSSAFPGTPSVSSSRVRARSGRCERSLMLVSATLHDRLVR